MFDTFLKWSSGPGEAGMKLIPDLATEVPSVQNGGISADGKTYTFHLRSGVRFAPPVNREVTAADWKYSFERMITLPEAWASSFFEGVVGELAYYNHKAKHISGIKVLDPHTIEIDLINPDPTFFYKITLPATFVVDKGWVKKWGKSVNHHPLGTGPFMFDHWTPGQQIVLKRNPNYWAADKVWLDGIEVKFGATPATALMQLEHGDIDVLGDPVPPSDIARVKADPNWKNNLISAPLEGTYDVFMNTKEKPFDNVKVRQAVNYAINTAKLAKVLAGQGEALDQIFPRGIAGYQANAHFYTYDPAKARQLLAEAGFPNGFKTTFWTLNVDPYPKMAQSVQYDLAQVGIKASIKQLDEGRTGQRPRTGTRTSRSACGIGSWTTPTRPTGSGRASPRRTRSPTAATTPLGGGTRGSRRSGGSRTRRWTQRSAPSSSPRCRRSSWSRLRGRRSTSRSTAPCTLGRPAASTCTRCGSSCSPTSGRRSSRDLIQRQRSSRSPSRP